MRKPLTIVLGAGALLALALWWSSSASAPTDLAKQGADPNGLDAPGLRVDGAEPGTPEPAAVDPRATVGPEPTQADRLVRTGGVVVDEGGALLKDAVVRLAGEDGTERTATTDAQGRYRLEVPAGRYHLTVATASGTIDLGWRTVDGAPSDAVLRTREGHAVRLRLSAGTEPIAGATVRLVRQDARTEVKATLATATSLPDGAVSLGSWPPGLYLVQIEPRAKVVYEIRHEHQSSTERLVAFRADARLAARVVDTEGVGIAGAVVRLSPNYGSGFGYPWRLRAEVRTDNDGAFEVVVPSREYIAPIALRVTADGYMGWSSHGSASSAVRRERSALLRKFGLMLIGSEQQVELPLRRRTDPVLRGAITNREGQPIPQLTATWTLLRHYKGGDRPDDDGQHITVTTDGAGRYQVMEMQPGKYRIVSPEGEFDHQTHNVLIRSNQEPIQRTDVIDRQRTLVLAGQVALADGTPAQGARVWVVESGPIRGDNPDDPSTRLITATDAEGRFEVHGHGVDKRYVWVRAAWGTLRSVPLRARLTTALDLALILQPAPALDLVVTPRDAANGLVGAEITFRPEGEPLGRTNWRRPVDDEGRVQQRLLAGLWDLEISSPLLTKKHVERVDLRGKTGLVPLRVEVDVGASVYGRVTDELGQPVIARLHISYASGGSVKQRMSSQPDGTFRVMGLTADQACWITVYAHGHRATRRGPVLAGTQGHHIELKRQD